MCERAVHPRKQNSAARPLPLRWNPLFFGLDEEEEESCEKRVIQVTQSVGLDGCFVGFCGVHRLGRKKKARNGQPSRRRPIIARFTCRADRGTVWRVRREIYKSARISIKEDLPKEIRETRKNILGPAMRKALKEKPNVKATILGERLIVNGRAYKYYQVC